MDLFDPKVLGDPVELRKFAERVRRYANALEAAADILEGKSSDRAIVLIENYIRENGATSEQDLIEALKDRIGARANPALEVKKSARAGLRHGRLVEKDGKILLPT